MSATPAGVTPPTQEQQNEIKKLSFKVGDNVLIAPVAPNTEVRKGICRYIGTTKFSEGLWVGIELVGTKGKNNGTVVGVAYFKCPPEQGVFVRHELVTPEGGNIAGITAQIAAAVKANASSNLSSTTSGAGVPPATTPSPSAASNAAPSIASPTKQVSKTSSSASLLDAARKTVSKAPSATASGVPGKAPAPPAKAASQPNTADRPPVTTQESTEPPSSVVKESDASGGVTKDVASDSGTSTAAAATQPPAAADPTVKENNSAEGVATEKVSLRVPTTENTLVSNTPVPEPAEPVKVSEEIPVSATTVVTAPAEEEEPPTAPKANKEEAHDEAPAVSQPNNESNNKHIEIPMKSGDREEKIPAVQQDTVVETTPTPVTNSSSANATSEKGLSERRTANDDTSSIADTKAKRALVEDTNTPTPAANAANVPEPPTTERPHPPVPVSVSPSPPPPPSHTPFMPMSNDPKKTLSGKTELELLADIEMLKDALKEAESKMTEIEEAKESLAVDLELAQEEKLLMEADMEEMQMKVAIAEKRAASAIASAAAGGSSSSVAVSTKEDDEAAALMVQLQKSARTAQEENARLRKQLQDMKEHVAAMDNQTAIIDNLTERNLELADELDEMRRNAKDLVTENDELKQLQFMLDEELALQREQADGFAAKITELQARLASDGSEADTFLKKLEEKNTALEDEVTRLKANLREANLKVLHASQGRALEAHGSNTTCEHMQSLVSRRYLPRHGFESRFGILGLSHRKLLTSVKAEDLEQKDATTTPAQQGKEEGEKENKREERGDKEMSTVDAPRLDAVAKSLTDLFAHVQDASHVCSVYEACDAIVHSLAVGMSAMEETVRSVTRVRRTAAAAAGNQLSDSLVSTFDMAVYDAAVAHSVVFADLQQLACALVDSRYHRHVLAYCKAKRDVLLQSPQSSGSAAQRFTSPTNVLEALHVIVNCVGLMTAAATLHTQGGAGHHGLAVSQLQGYLSDARAAMAFIHTELNPFFGSYVFTPASAASNASAESPETRKGFAAAVELSCGDASWWTSVPSGEKAQISLAKLTQALVLAAAFACEQSHRTLTGTSLSDHVAVVRPDTGKGEVDADGLESDTAEERDETGEDIEAPPADVVEKVEKPIPKPINNNFLPSELGGRVNAIDTAESLQDTIKLLHKAEAQLRDNLGEALRSNTYDNVDDGQQSIASPSSPLPLASSCPSLRFCAVESSLALLLIFRATSAFAALVRTAEADVHLGLVSDVGVAFREHCIATGNGRLECLASPMRFLEGSGASSSSLSLSSGVKTASPATTSTAESTALQANMWPTSKSLALSYVCSVYGVPLTEAITATGSLGMEASPSSIIGVLGFFNTPLIRTITSSVATSLRRGVTAEKGQTTSTSGYDDLKTSSTATLASLFVHGGIRKDINAFVSSGSNNTQKTPMVMPVAMRLRREMLLAVAKAAPEMFAGLGGPSGGVDKEAHAALMSEIEHLSRELQSKAQEHTTVVNKCEELQLRLWEAQSEQNVVQMMQKEVEGMRGTMTQSEAKHKLELEQQTKEWSEAYESVEKARQALSREVKQLKSEEKLSPLSASERRQHNLLLGYYSTMLGELLLGGSGVPSPIGLRSDNGKISEACEDLVNTMRDEDYTNKIAELCEATVSVASPLVIGPSVPNKVGLYPTRAFPSEVQSTETMFFSRHNSSFLSTEAADRLLRFLHRKPSSAAGTATKDGEADQPASQQQVQRSEKVEQKQREIIAIRKRHEGSTLYLTSLPKIRRFTSAAECKEARLGVLLSTQ